MLTRGGSSEGVQEPRSGETERLWLYKGWNLTMSLTPRPYMENLCWRWSPSFSVHHCWEIVPTPAWPRTSLPVSTPNTIHHSRLTVCLPDSLDLDHFVLVKRLWISWFPRLRFRGRSRNLEFTITIIALMQNVKDYLMPYMDGDFSKYSCVGLQCSTSFAWS